MKEIIKGPALVFVLASLCLFLAVAYADPVRADFGSSGQAALSPFPLARLLQGTSVTVGSTLWVLLTAASAALAAHLYWTWSGNRIVSVLGALVFALHPLQAAVAASPGALPSSLSTGFVLAALLMRERGWILCRRGGSPLQIELLALLLVVVAAFAGPAFLAYPAAVLLMDAVFHRQDSRDTKREIVPRAVLFSLIVLGLWHLVRPDRGSSADVPAFSQHFSSLLIPGLEGGVARLVAALVLAVTSAALFLGVRSQQRTPKLAVLQVAFAGAWFLLVESTARLGSIGSNFLPTPLALLGLGLAVPALCWRALLALSPEPVENPRLPTPRPPVPTAPDHPASSHQRSWPDLSVLVPHLGAGASEPTLRAMIPAVRDAVDAAVGTAVEASVGGALRAARALGEPGPGGRLAALEREWKHRARARATERTQATSEAHVQEELFFRTYLEPLLAPEFTVVEIGPRRGALTARILPRVRQIILVDESPRVLADVRAALLTASGLTAVRASPENPSALASSIAEVVVAADWFTFANLAAVHRGLRSLAGWLKPGGVAAIAFANLLDPVAQRRFLAEAEAGQITSRMLVTPEMVRTLADLAGLSVRSFHLAADGRDLWVLLERRSVA